MPILEIGKTKAYSQSGYTLFEILAVLIMLSIIGLLVFPRFDSGEEKAYLKQIGELIQADIQTVSEEAVAEKSEIVVELFTTGYRFEIGDFEIKRVFDKFQFHWDFASADIEKKEKVEAVETLELSAENDADLESGNLELSFNSDGDFPETTMGWATKHFTGSLLLNSDGNVNWDYGPR